jgi:multifunctional methyltransferase subunit TRM112
MKIFTLNFLICPRSTCKTSPLSFPLHPRPGTCELEQLAAPEEDSKSTLPDSSDTSLQRAQTIFLQNMLQRIEWSALRTVCTELGLMLPWASDEPPEPEALWEPLTTSSAQDQDAMKVDKDDDGDESSEDEQVDRTPSKLALDLHAMLMETSIAEGTLFCGSCGHEYFVKEGIGNFLLPGHMV